MRFSERNFIAVCTLIALALFSSAAPAQDSPLIQGRTADFWIVDPETGEVTGYDAGKWLDGINPADYPLIDFGGADAFLINRLPNSSVPMTPGQPAISLVGIGDAALLAGEGGSGGRRDLTLTPESGNYTDTIAVVMGVSGSVLADSEHRLSWTVVETGSGSTVIEDGVLIPGGSGGSGENGYHFETFYLVNTGDYAVSVRLQGAALDTTLAAGYDLSIDPSKLRRDSDGDGIPDMVEVDMGLNPLENDWMADTDGNGWSQFDEWLRRFCLDPVTLQPLDAGPECLDADGLPLDTDTDNWTDFDEILRGTHHLDPEPDIASDPYVAEQRLRYKDFPAANRLYEVEHLIERGAGVLSVPPVGNLQLDQQGAGGNEEAFGGIVVQSYTAGQDNIAGIDFRVAAGGEGVEDIILNIWADSLRDGELLLSRKIKDVVIDGDPDRPIVIRFEPVAVQPGQPVFFEFRMPTKTVALVATGADTIGGGAVIEVDGAAVGGAADLVFDVYYDTEVAKGLGVSRAGMQWWTVGAADLDGSIAYDATRLLADDDIMAAGLLPTDIASRRQMTALKNTLGNSELPEMRLPAGDSIVIAAVHRHSTPAQVGWQAPADYSRIYKGWLARTDDITPTAMLAEMGEGTWTTPEEWRREFIAYLVPRLVLPVAVVLDESSTINVAVIEAALSEEAELDGSGGIRILTGLFQPAQPIYSYPPGQPGFGNLGTSESPYVSDWEDNLERIAVGDFDLDQSIAAVAIATGPGMPLEAVGSFLRNQFMAGEPGTQSDVYMADQMRRSFPDVCFLRAASIPDLQANVDGWNAFLNQCPVWFDEVGLAQRLEDDHDRNYRVRLNVLPGAATEVASDASLLDLANDSDFDGLLNASEVEVPVGQLTLPWAFDSDGDGIGDSVDQCPIDPFNDCSANPILPTVTLEADFTVVEPASDSNFALISVQLDRIYDVPVTVCYEAFVDLGDTATPDVDYQAVADCVVIDPGQLSTLIEIPIIADAEIDAGETFSVRITGISNASISGDGIVVITLDDPPAGPLPSSNADLNGLTFTNAILGPPFQADVSSYTATVDFAIDATNPTATAADPGASIAINGLGALSGQPAGLFALNVGNNQFDVVVTAEDGVTQQTYDVIITRLPPVLSSNADLADLSLSAAALDQIFQSNLLDYTASVEFTATSTTVTPTTADAGATVTVDGLPVVSGVPSAQIALVEGDTSISVEVTAEDGITSKTYVVTVTRQMAATFAQSAYIKASNTGPSDRFGSSVELDGDTLVVAAEWEESDADGINGDQADNNAFRAGAVYVFVRDASGIWTQQAYIKASNSARNHTFGTGISLDGDTLVVGSPGERSDATGINGNQAVDSLVYAGAAYIFTRDGTGNWSQQAYIKPPIMELRDGFGYSVELAGDTLAIGMSGDDSNATGVGGNMANNDVLNSGAVHMYTRDGSGTWSHHSFIKASNPGASDGFGSEIAIDVDTMVVGVRSEDSSSPGVNADQADNSALDAGAVYVFTRDGTGNWSQQAYIKASNPETADDFGISVDVSGDTLVVGAQREASNATGFNGDQANNDSFGAGAVYIFTRDGGGIWSQQVYVKASDTDPTSLSTDGNLTADGFGISIALSDNTLLVGAGGEESGVTGVNGDQFDATAAGAGAAYLFTRDGSGTWTQLAYIKASNTDAGDGLGGYRGIAISGSTFVIGAKMEDGGTSGVGGDESSDTAVDAGGAYVFD